MVLITFLLLIGSTVGAVFMPRFAPFLLVLMYRLIDLGISPLLIVCVCSITATLTTTGIWYLGELLHKYIEHNKKNEPNQKGLSWRMRRRFDRTFSIIKSQRVLFFAMIIGSGSMIPDIFLVEFGRLKMKFWPFIIAILLGKVATYALLLVGLDNIIDTFVNLVTG